MADLVWSDDCAPAIEGGSRDEGYEECCSARFEFAVQVIPGRGYFPNECQASPALIAATIGPMIVDMEVVSDGIEVDDELLVNGEVFEAGQHRVTLGAGTTGTGASFSGGTSLCNGRHNVVAGKILAVVPQGDSVQLGVGDNHGIDIEINGAVIVRPVSAP
jgi:hypothetical protein